MAEPSPIHCIFVWHCLTDACEKCRALSGKEWREQDLFHDTLWDMIWGDIWDLNNNMSLAHPNCRCLLSIRVEFSMPEVKELETLNDFLWRLGL